MTPEEKSFLKICVKDPDVDQLVVEHTYFLQGWKDLHKKKPSNITYMGIEVK
jgi:hypothetical protein